MHHILLIRHAECVMNLHLATTIGGRANDSPLTRRGRAQAAALGKRLAGLPEDLRPKALFASTAVRARETAEAISRALSEKHAVDLPVKLREELLEIEMGAWAGKDRKSTYTPEVLSQIRERPLDFAAPGGGESQREVEERVARCIESEVLSAAAAAAAEAAKRRGSRSSSSGNGKNGERTKAAAAPPPPPPAAPVVVAVVAHGVSIKTFLRRVLASDPRGFAAARNISLANTGICEVATAAGGVSPPPPFPSSWDRERWHLIRVNDAAHLEGLIGEVFDEDAEEEEEEEVEASSPRLDA